MLAKPDVEVVYEEGVAVGVSSEGETAKAKLVRFSLYSCFAVDTAALLLHTSDNVKAALSAAVFVKRLYCLPL